MSTRALVDPELQAPLDYFPDLTLSAEALPAVRAALDAMSAASPIDETIPVDLEIRSIAGGDGQPMDVRIYRPRDTAGPLPAVLQFHGGGYVFGSARDGEPGYRALAASLGVLVVSVGYRLAPETRYPGQVEDAYAALTWLHAAADELGVDRTRIAIRGDSAGGGLAACLALHARDRGGPAICFQLLLAPMLDDRTGSIDVPNPMVGEFVWTRASNRFGWEALLGYEPGGNTPAHAAAGRADDLSGLPPAYVTVGSLDLFLEENLAYCARLARAGVPAEIHVYAGAYHGFEIAPEATVTRRAAMGAIEALARAFGLPSPA